MQLDAFGSRGIEVRFDIQRDPLFKRVAAHDRLFSRRSRNSFIFIRALLTWERTVTSDEPKIPATSRVESPSISRNTRAARSFSGSRFRASFTKLRFSARLNSASRSVE